MTETSLKKSYAAVTAMPAGKPITRLQAIETVGTKKVVGRAVPPNASFCEGDTTMVYNLLPDKVKDKWFETLKTEVQWFNLSIRGGEIPRLVAVQGAIDEEGNRPLYRYPADRMPPLSPFSPTVRCIKQAAEAHVGHALNHVLIQWYRDGHDHIGEHSDKTLDIVPGTVIANVSLGAQRTMLLTRKDNGATVRIPLPHNSMLRMGLRTNMAWFHGLRPDRRPARAKTAAEAAFAGGRISLTFRHIGTFTDKNQRVIWGQGAVGKTRDAAQPVIAVAHGHRGPARRLLCAFGAENQAIQFDWHRVYGHGFNLLPLPIAA